jgi:tRNA threonylcarbamoyladenosine biosynthesis protein TsaE
LESEPTRVNRLATERLQRDDPVVLLPTSDEQQQQIGRTLGEAPVDGAIVLLEGELGSGKTTLARGFLRGRGYGGAVRSPTYTLVEPYELESGPVWHLDLYRLADPDELEYLGLRDALDGATTLLIEWPRQGGDLLPPADLLVELVYRQESGRMLTLTPLSDRGEQLVSRLRVSAR